MFDPTTPYTFPDFIGEFTVQTMFAFLVGNVLDEIFSRLTKEYGLDSGAVRFSLGLLQMLVNAIILYLLVTSPFVQKWGLKDHWLNTTAGLTFSATYFGIQSTMIGNFRAFNTTVNV